MAAARLTSFRTPGEASLLCQTLGIHGIAATLRGENLPSIAGELPLGEARVEVWVDESDRAAAQQVVDAMEANSMGADQVCSRCQEISPAEFDYCWQCRTAFDARFR